ncbi:hypothetical protein GALMADRAFT_270456 [Galerina marginata CBS 339.88]|uniref:Isomerase YbhE n=1 Tax=Galerina marginata (strain CBS 339.88) TaxID=685588 RepID=A0A067SZH3_GALM3|nr:hypothetical protein GALMADRAFT_270456 [Galerina marginata CBS 339.88]
MVSFKILAGGFDVFVATYVFNTATSSLTLQSTSPTGPSPSWITRNPFNRSLLYAVNELDPNGGLQSFAIQPDGSLSAPIDTVSSGGGNPAFVTTLSSGSVAVMNFFGGNGRIIPTTSKGTKFDASAPIITFPPPVGGVSHPHMALELGGEVLVPDLGGDKIWRLKENPITGAFGIQGFIPQPLGSGPRHIAFFNNRLFTIHELSSTLSVQTLPPLPNGTSTTFSSISITPPNPPPGALFAGAEILIPPPTPRFPTPLIYVSNRNTGVQAPDGEGDSIAIFEHVNQGRPDLGERLVLVKQVFTGLDQIRGMEFGNVLQGTDEFLVAGGVAGTAGVVILKRTEGGRNLEIVARNLDVPTRSTFIWL